MNSSTLKHGLHSAEHLKAAIDGRMSGSESKATTFGRALHARVLEPDEYNQRFTIASGCQELLKTGASKGFACGKSAKYLFQGKFVCGGHLPPAAKDLCDPVPNLLTIEEAQDIEAAAAVISGKKVNRLLKQRGGFETTVISEIDGVRVKCRLDKYVPRQGELPPVILDLKKVGVGRGDDESFGRSAFDYGYDVSAAFYVDAVETLIGEKPVFIWLIVEDGYPHSVNVIQADDDTLTVGRIRYRECLGKYIVGMQTGQWPGYADEIKCGGLPGWAKAKYLK